MTLDEALEKCKYGLNFTDEEHDQLAEWLEELKAFQENKWTDIYIKRGYDKAIDDFKSEVKDLINNSTVIRHKDVDEVAEQLKESEAE